MSDSEGSAELRAVVDEAKEVTTTISAGKSRLAGLKREIKRLDGLKSRVKKDDFDSEFNNDEIEQGRGFTQ